MYRRGNIHGYRIRLPSLRQLWSRRSTLTRRSLRLALFPLPRLDVVDGGFPASASPTTSSTGSSSFITRRRSSFLDFPVMLLHLFLKLLHLRAGEATGREGGKGLMDVDGEDLEDFLHVYVVFRAEGLGVEGFLQRGR